MAYIIGEYDRYRKWDREHAQYVFCVNDKWSAIYRVGMEWGLPQVEQRLEDNSSLSTYYVYERLEDAMEYVKLLKRLN